MERCSITITTRNGVRYDANHISIERQQVDGKSYSQVSFICSGMRTTLMADSVKSVDYHPNGTRYCSECDKPIVDII